MFGIFTVVLCVGVLATILEIVPGDRFLEFFLNQIFPVVAGLVFFVHDSEPVCLYDPEVRVPVLRCQKYNSPGGMPQGVKRMVIMRMI